MCMNSGPDLSQRAKNFRGECLEHFCPLIRSQSRKNLRNALALRISDRTQSISQHGATKCAGDVAQDEAQTSAARTTDPLPYRRNAMHLGSQQLFKDVGEDVVGC